jgi:hypothetical protein
LFCASSRAGPQLLCSSFYGQDPTPVFVFSYGQDITPVFVSYGQALNSCFRLLRAGYNSCFRLLRRGLLLLLPIDHYAHRLTLSTQHQTYSITPPSTGRPSPATVYSFRTIPKAIPFNLRIRRSDVAQIRRTPPTTRSMKVWWVKLLHTFCVVHADRLVDAGEP